jgi:hypothetical protein
MEVAKKMHASSVSRRDAESSVRFKDDDSMVKNEWTLRETHMERSEADDEAPFFVGEARKMAFN